MTYEWIPVGERLPEGPTENPTVLAAVPGHAGARVAFLGMDRKWRWATTGVLMTDVPTHWMPMPPLPWEGGVEDAKGPQPAAAVPTVDEMLTRRALVKRLDLLESRLAVLEARQPVDPKTYPSWPPSPYRFTCGPAVSDNKAA